MLIRRPDIIGDDLQDKDTELYDKAAIAVDDLSERIFIVLNQLRDSEEAKLACQRFNQKLNDGRLGINFIDCIIADCSNPDEANQIVLDNGTNKYFINVASNKFEGSKWNVIGFGFGNISSYNCEIEVCESQNPNDYKIVSDWISKNE